MFKIYDGRDKFFQWDLDRKLIVADKTIKAVHFCNRTGVCSITRYCYDANGMWLVDVPNLCLQESYRLRVYGFSEAKYTMEVQYFEVEARTKPEDYVYTETEVACWEVMDERLRMLEENPVSEEALAAAIEAYFAANPIEKGVGKAVAGYEGAEIFNDYANNIASWNYAHAEGYNTQATNVASHAEGSETIAAGVNSHAEGTETKATGHHSHAEGIGSNATGTAAHAEGGSNATGDFSHAEGCSVANGRASHAEGEGTIADGHAQHVQGKYNIQDSKYAHIVGNGHTPEDYGEPIRSNAHTLDWDGNAWFAGNIRVGGTSWEDATELGAGGESAIEFVNATGDETIELDKTYDEIMAMVEAGKVVVVKYNGELYYQYSDSPAFRYVGSAETRYIGYNKKTNAFKYSETILPTFEDVEDTINNAMPNYLTGYATEEYVDNAIANAGAGSADCSVMVIKSNNSADSIQLDKTFNEIQTATDEGKTVVILHKNKYYHLTQKGLSLFTFSCVEKTKIEKILVYQSVVRTSVDNFITTYDIANFQTAEQVEEAINAAKPDLTDYALKSDIPSLDGYAKQEDIPSLEGYAKTTDIPDVSGYQTAEQVQTAIENYVGVIENGSY